MVFEIWARNNFSQRLGARDALHPRIFAAHCDISEEVHVVAYNYVYFLAIVSCPDLGKAKPFPNTGIQNITSES